MVLHVWGVPAPRVPMAVARARLRLAALRRGAGVRFARLLGTGSGATFAARHPDLRHWALLSVWDPADVAGADAAALVRGLDDAADERLRVALRPLHAVGRWGGCRPFAPTADEGEPDGPVAALTRARLRAGSVARFRRAVPAVAADLAARPGLRVALGIGEDPLMHQGTFSLWESAATLDGFVHGHAHRAVVRRTPAEDWYAEETFARFAVREVTGTYRGTAP